MRLRESYDHLAEAYARELFDELSRKPLDRAILSAFAEELEGRGEVADIGCGPGQVALFLHERGLQMVGVDLSEGMLEVARRLVPGVRFVAGSLMALPQADGAFAGATSFYSIVHLERDELVPAFRELARVLGPGAPLLCAFHAGDERMRRDELFGVAIDLEWVFHPTESVAAAMEAAGLTVEWRLERHAHPAEHPSDRGYVLGRKP